MTSSQWLDIAVLGLAQADAQVRKLEANYRRASQLVEQKMVSVNDVDQLRYDLENARASLRMARLELSYGTVTAPMRPVKTQSVPMTATRPPAPISAMPATSELLRSTCSAPATLRCTP